MRIVLGMLLLLAPTVLGAGFVDPAPPEVAAVKTDAAVAEAKAQAELTFRAAPKPLAKEAVTTDWPCFLGPTHSPISTETNLRADLKDLPVVWETEKGTGYSHVTILGDRLLLFHRVKDEEVVDCLHPLTGRRYWRFAYPCEYQDRYGYTNGPRCAPVIDAGASLVFAFGVEGKLHALDLKTGAVVWKRDLLAEFKLRPNFFGVGATPLLEGNLLIVNVGAKDACVVGFDVTTGKAKWASPAPKDWGPSYASPIPATVHGVRRVFAFAGGESRPATGGLLCIDPADGSVDFAFPWRGKRPESVNASSPLIVDGDKVFISECYGRGGALLQMTLGDDKRLAVRTLWKSEALADEGTKVDKLSTHFMTALPLAGHLYGCDGHGPADCPLVCVEIATGDEKWRTELDLSETVTIRGGGERRPVKLSTCLAHLLRVDGKTLCLTEWGHLLYLELTPAGVKVASRTWLFAGLRGENWTPPVLSHGLLYVNQNTPDVVSGAAPRLICYDLRK